MTLFESFLTVLDNVFGVVVMILDCLLPMAIMILLIIWLTQRSTVKSMLRMYGSDAEYENERLSLRKRSKPAMVVGWILFTAGLVFLIGGLTWVTYVESNNLSTGMRVWDMSRYIMTYSVFAWFGGLCLVFARFVYLETKSVHLLRARLVQPQETGKVKA